MRKDIQDLAWSVLPKEFKEEVKETYREFTKKLAATTEPGYRIGYIAAQTELEFLFGKHNLTSDAEGEEMLTANKKDVQEQYALQITALQKGNLSDLEVEYRVKLKDMLYFLFGSKCLPDDSSKSFGELLDTMNDLVNKIIDKLDSKTAEPEELEHGLEQTSVQVEDCKAEPKFKVGDKTFFVFSPTIKYKCTITKVMQNEHNGKWEYDVLFEWGKPGKWVPESDLEPYTEPQPATECSNLDKESSTCTDDCPSQCKSKHRNLLQETANCDKQFDTILKDSFSQERRLNIAVQILSGIVASSKPCKHPIMRALELTDALIGECEKEGMK